MLPIPDEKSSSILLKDIEFREVNLGGNGGQHRNRHYTDIIATHLPSGIRVTARGRSQSANKVYATQLLSAKVIAMQNEQSTNSLNNIRRNQIGSGERSDKIRTVRYQDGIVTCEVTGQKMPLKSYLSGKISFD